MEFDEAESRTAESGNAFRGAQLRKIYRTGEVEVQALRGVDLAIPSGEFLVLLGPSGIGKSTLLNSIGGLDRLPPGSHCIANAYTSNHDALEDPNIGAGRAFVLHAIDAVGLVHAAILRLQALLLPVQTLVLSGGH